MKPSTAGVPRWVQDMINRKKEFEMACGGKIGWEDFGLLLTLMAVGVERAKADDFERWAKNNRKAIQYIG